MKKIIIFIILMLLSINASAWCLRDKCKEKERQEALEFTRSTEEVGIVEEEKKCYSAFPVNDDEILIYEHECILITQIAVINEDEKRVYHVNGKEIDGYYKYVYDEQLEKYIKENFPGVSPLPKIHRK